MTLSIPDGGDDRARLLAQRVAKVKRHVLPLFVIMFIVNYIDRVNVGFVRGQLETDLGIGVAAYGLGAGLFFIGYALFEMPSNVMLQRVGARVWLTRIMLTWGLVAMAMAFVRSESGFCVLRFLPGAAEAGFYPGILYYFTQLAAPARTRQSDGRLPQRIDYSRNVCFDPWRRGTGVCSPLLCGCRFQGGVGTVLAITTRVPGCTYRSRCASSNQFAG